MTRNILFVFKIQERNNNIYVCFPFALTFKAFPFTFKVKKIKSAKVILQKSFPIISIRSRKQ